MNKEERLYYLLNRVLAQTATEDELQELAAAVKDDLSGKTAEQAEAFLSTSTSDTSQLSQARMDAMANAILTADKSSPIIPISTSKTPVFRLSPRIAAAVAILLILGTAAFWWFGRVASKNPPKDQRLVQSSHDMAPGGNKARLTLGDGSVIVLDSAANGTIAHQDNTSIRKLNDDQLLYSEENKGNTGVSPGYNLLSTPRGGQYQMTLSDGTKIWLNAASSLRFPTFFTGNERVVELTGEGYFEVAKSAGRPFKIKVKEMQVEVLGTHFNIMAYDEEQVVRTTLLEGAIKVSNRTTNRLLKPGEQTSLDLASNVLHPAHEADTEEAIAWKNGYFQFNKIDSSSLRQLSRWYNIDVVYEGGIRENEFKGKINRNIKLSSVIEAFQISGIHCRIEKNSVIILP